MDGNNNGNNRDINNSGNIRFTNTEVSYLKKIYKTVPRRYIPKKPEEVKDLKALNRAILDKRKTVNKENCKDRGQGFHSFMNAAEANGYITKNNYGLYATFYDVYDPNDPTMKRTMDDVLKRKVTEHTPTRRSNMNIRLFVGIVGKCHASKNTLKAIEDPKANNALDKMIHINDRLFTDAQKGRSLGFDVKDVPRKQEKVEDAPKNPYENMTLEEMERAFYKLNRDFERKQRQQREEKEIEEELNELDEQVNKKEEEKPQKEEEKKEEPQKEEEKIEEPQKEEEKKEEEPQKEEPEKDNEPKVENPENEVKIENEKEEEVKQEENNAHDDGQQDGQNDNQQEEQIEENNLQNENIIQNESIIQNENIIHEENPERQEPQQDEEKQNEDIQNEEKQEEQIDIQNNALNENPENIDKQDDVIIEENNEIENNEIENNEVKNDEVENNEVENDEVENNGEVNEENPEENNLQEEENNIQNENNLQEEENNIQNENNVQDDVVNEEQQVEEPQPVVDENARPVLDDHTLRMQANKAEGGLRLHTLKMRGSAEYKNVREEFIKVNEKFKNVCEASSKEGTISGLSEKNARELRNDLQNVMQLCDKYIGKKHAEKDKSDNAKFRVDAVKDTFDAAEEMVHALDVHLEKLAQKPAPNLDELEKGFASTNKAIEGSKLHLRGSKEFDAAADAFDDISKRMYEISKAYNGHDDKITTTELYELRNRMVRAQGLVNNYLDKKTGNAVGDNATKRTAAMSAAANALEVAIRRINQVEELKFSKEPDDLNKLSTKSAPAVEEMQKAESGVYFGSSEYEKAKKSFNAFDDKLKELSAPDHQLTYREADQLNKALLQASRDVSAYLNTKNATTFDQKTLRRVNIMRKAGDILIETKRRMDILTNERRAEAVKSDRDVMGIFESETSGQLKAAKTSVDGSKVWFGGEDFDKAQALYETAVFHELQRDAARKDEPPTKSSLQAELKELKEAKDATLVYIERKEKQMKDSGKPLDRKGAERFRQMKNAYDSLNLRIDIAQERIQDMEHKEIEESKEKMKDFVNKLDCEIPGKTGVDKIVAMNAASSAKKLQNLSQQKQLTNASKQAIRQEAANLFLAQNIKDKTFKINLAPTMDAYRKIATQIAESPEFKAALPDDKLNQSTCRKLLSDPNTMNKLKKDFNLNVQKSAAKNQTKKMVPDKNLNKENKTEVQNGPHK